MYLPIPDRFPSLKESVLHAFERVSPDPKKAAAAEEKARIAAMADDGILRRLVSYAERTGTQSVLAKNMAKFFSTLDNYNASHPNKITLLLDIAVARFIATAAGGREVVSADYLGGLNIHQNGHVLYGHYRESMPPSLVFTGHNVKSVFHFNRDGMREMEQLAQGLKVSATSQLVPSL